MSWEVSPRSKTGVNELSPRKFPRSPLTSPRKQLQNSLIPPKTPPQWKRPEDVMKSHRIRVKRNALTARMRSNELFQKAIEPSTKSFPKTGAKRNNPFKCISDVSEVPEKKVKESQEDSQNDDNLFKLLGLNTVQESQQSLYNFTSQLESQTDIIKIHDTSKYFSELPIDWTLRHKMRFVSSVPFPWNKTLKTCEEASSVTGFVRCIQDEPGECKGLITSPNVELHQCCYYWQHPNLPWLQLFPRIHLRRSDPNKIPFITMYPDIKDSLHRDWSESFRSLFQLVRARHCPYFYLVTSSLNCLFRAAGVNGISETNAVISPTSQGFRKLLAKEGIEFSMPLKAKHKRISQDFENGENGLLEGEVDEEEDGASEAKEWLASLGVGEEELKEISETEASNKFNVEKKLEENDESLIYVEGCEINALFNFLINCRSITVTTGPLAGVPPTLLSPVAFQGGTLASLKVRENTVKVDDENFFSLEIKGPILPHALHNLCNVFKNNVDKFSITFASVESSKAFSSVAKKTIGGQETSESDMKNPPVKVFSIENLSDCGLKQRFLSTLCSAGVQQFDSIKFSGNSYICS